LAEIKEIKESLGEKSNLFIAVNPFKPNEDGQLEFKTGDVIKVYRQQEDGWWEGTINDRIGSFPAQYVKPLEEAENNENNLEKEKSDLNEEKSLETEKKKPLTSGHTLHSYLPPGGLQHSDMPVLRSVKKSPTQSNNSEGIAEVCTSVGSCSTCGCDEFKSNVFKPGSCNNCFHRHTEKK
jgi:hypothetical protein